MRDLHDALERARAGGPQRHHEKSAQQGKLPVRERIERLGDPGPLPGEALLANWEMGGARMHTGVSGVGHFLVGSDEEAIELAKRYLSYFPASWREDPPPAPPA